MTVELSDQTTFRTFLHRWNLRTLYEHRLDMLAHGRLTIEQFHQLCDEYCEEWGYGR